MRLVIEGLGPIKRVEHQITDSIHEIRGPSQSGKSTAMDAYCWALWGQTASGRPLAVEAVRDGHSRCRVEIEEGDHTLERAMTQRRGITRRLDGDRIGSEKLWRQVLGDLGREVSGESIGLLIAAPMLWRRLAEGPGHGRPLRDLLAAILPGTDEEEVGALMAEQGQTLDDHDPTNLREAERWRTTARRDADRAQGALDEARRQMERIDDRAPDGPSDAEIKQARQVLSRAEAQAAYREAWKRHQSALRLAQSWDERARQVEAMRPAEPYEHDYSLIDEGREADRQRRRAETELREIDGRGAARTKAWEVRLRALQQTLSKVQADDHRHLRGEVERLQREAELLDGVPCLGRLLHVPGTGDPPETVDTSTCQFLGRARQALDDLPVAEQALEDAQDETQAEIERLQRELETLRAEAEEDIRAGRERDDEDRRVAQEALDAAEKRVAEARERGDYLADLRSAWAAYEAARQALGQRPTVPEAPADAPVEVTDDEVARAREALRAHAQAEGARQARERASQQAEQALEDAKTTAQRARQARAHADALVEALRRAPSVRLRRGIDSLGLPSIVEVQVPEDRDGVDVLVDGRPWDLASTGRQVYADALFRAALRRATGLDVPLWIDRAQDWSGGWEGLDHAILLITEGE